MSRKVETIDLHGNEYAKVPDRLKQFREDCPRGKIITRDELEDSGQRKFYAYVWKDRKNYTKEDLDSADAKGSALGVTKGEKDFEKLETIAIGRALAILGYLASGEVASFEEMEEYYRERDQKQAAYLNEQLDLFENAKDLDELKQLWASTNKALPELVKAKDKRKAELEEAS